MTKNTGRVLSVDTTRYFIVREEDLESYGTSVGYSLKEANDALEDLRKSESLEGIRVLRGELVDVKLRGVYIEESPR